MIPILLIAAALGVSVILLLILMGRHADRSARIALADETIGVLKEQLEQALKQQANLKQRVENLEAIVTSETWDSASQDASASAPHPALTLPEEPSDEDKAALLAKRQRSR